MAYIQVSGRTAPRYHQYAIREGKGKDREDCKTRGHIAICLVDEGGDRMAAPYRLNDTDLTVLTLRYRLHDTDLTIQTSRYRPHDADLMIQAARYRPHA